MNEINMNFGIYLLLGMIILVDFIFFKAAVDNYGVSKEDKTILILTVLVFLITLGIHFEGSIYYKEINVTKDEYTDTWEIAKGNSQNEFNFNGMGIFTYYSIKSDNSNQFIYWYITEDGSYMQNKIPINKNFKVYEIEEDRCYLESAKIVTKGTYKSKWFGEEVIEIDREPSSGYYYSLYVPKGTITNGNVTLE